VGQQNDGGPEYDRRMSAEAIDSSIPEILTLSGLASMNEADTHGYRYELSPEGVLFVMPPPGFDHARVLNRLTGWLLAAGWTLEQVFQAVGLRIPGRDGGMGGRIPDLVVWREPPPPSPAVWLPTTGIALVVEVMSHGSMVTDRKVKLDEYADAGIPRYWTVDRDAAQTVTMYELADGAYTSGERMPLEWLLNTKPSDHLA
jgi:Uma2 family endonuclease